MATHDDNIPIIVDNLAVSNGNGSASLFRKQI